MIAEAFNELTRVVSSSVSGWSLNDEANPDFDDEPAIFGSESDDEEKKPGDPVDEALEAADMRVNAVLNVVSGAMSSVVSSAKEAKKHVDEMTAQTAEEFGATEAQEKAEEMEKPEEGNDEEKAATNNQKADEVEAKKKKRTRTRKPGC